jgi:hypothetical protein
MDILLRRRNSLHRVLFLYTVNTVDLNILKTPNFE